MYDRMLSIASKIEQNDYSNSTMEITILFGMTIWQDIEKIRNLLDELKCWEDKWKRYWELCDTLGYSHLLDFEASREGAAQKTIEAAQAQDEKFAIITDCEYFDPDIEPEEYDREEISSQDSLTRLRKGLDDNTADRTREQWKWQDITQNQIMKTLSSN